MNFITNIPAERFNAFTSTHIKNHFFQSYEWGVFKAKTPGWDFDTVGLEDEQGNLVATALVLFRYLPVIKRPFLYAPRGFVIDFNNKELLAEFTKQMKQYTKSKGAIFFKIDPDIKYVDRDIEGEITPDATNNQALIDELVSMGYKHIDSNQGPEAVIQPRYTFRVNLAPSEKELLENCHPKTRYNIKIAQKKGIEIVEGNREDLPVFEEIMRVTGERDGFLTRPLSYFENMYDALAPSGICKLYFAKLNMKQALESLQKDLQETEALIPQYESQLQNEELTEKKRQKIENKLQQEQSKLSKSQSQLESLRELSLKHPTEVIMSGIITVSFGNKSWYLYGASDNIYREFMPNYLIQWHALTTAKNEGYEIYDLFGISGRTNEFDPTHGLYRFKKGFSGEFNEFIGEFDYVVNRFWYFVWEVLLPQFKNYKKRLRKKMKKSDTN